MIQTRTHNRSYLSKPMTSWYKCTYFMKPYCLCFQILTKTVYKDFINTFKKDYAQNTTSYIKVTQHYIIIKRIFEIQTRKNPHIIGTMVVFSLYCNIQYTKVEIFDLNLLKSAWVNMLRLANIRSQISILSNLKLKR